MADWRFTERVQPKGAWFMAAICYPSFGDAFSPDFPVPPTDNLMISTLNFSSKGSVKGYSADMTFVSEYGPGEEYLLHDPVHFAMGKVVLVAATDDVEYCCLRALDGTFIDGEILTLSPNEARTFTGLVGKSLIVSDGEVASTDKTYAKRSAVMFEETDSITLTAGPEGAMLVLFWKLPSTTAV